MDGGHVQEISVSGPILRIRNSRALFRSMDCDRHSPRPCRLVAINSTRSRDAAPQILVSAPEVVADDAKGDHGAPRDARYIRSRARRRLPHVVCASRRGSAKIERPVRRDGGQVPRSLVVRVWSPRVSRSCQEWFFVKKGVRCLLFIGACDREATRRVRSAAPVK